MTSRLCVPSVLFALGVGFADVCGAGVAHANEYPVARYEVTGPGVAEFIAYQTDSGQAHVVNVPLPWSTEFTSFGGEVYSLSAQGAGNIRCRILLDGNVVSDTQSAGGRTVCTH